MCARSGSATPPCVAKARVRCAPSAHKAAILGGSAPHAWRWVSSPSCRACTLSAGARRRRTRLELARAPQPKGKAADTPRHFRERVLYIICDGEGTGTGLASTTDVRVPTPEFRGVRFQLPSAVFPCFIVPPAPPGVIVVFLNRLPMCVPATPVYLNRNVVPASPVTFYRYDESRGARLTNEDGLRPAPRGRNSFAAIASRGSTSARARCKSARITRMRAPRRVAAHPRH